MAELVDWLHHESITRAATNTASSYVRQDHHLPHGSLEPTITNGDRIRMMTDEELAEKLTWIVPYCGDCPARIDNGEECAKDCKKAWLKWLRKECNG